MFDLQSLIKYLLEGLAVAVAAYLIPKKKIEAKEIALIALTAAAIFAVLDQFAPLVALGARQGAGFGIGFQTVGFGLEGFDDQSMEGTDDGLEGYDDYDYETFDATSSGTSGDASANPSSSTSTSSTSSGSDDHVDSQGVCKMSDDKCTYNPDAKPEQKAFYLCSKDNDQCNPMQACKKNDQGQCDWADKAKDLADAAGRMCQLEDVNGKKNCRLTTSTPAGSKSTEGFTSDNILGFEGFSKVF